MSGENDEILEVPHVPTVTLDELRARLASGSPPPVLVEAMPLPYYRHSHLPGALHLPPDQVARVAPDLLPDRSAEIIVYCQGPG